MPSRDELFRDHRSRNLLHSTLLLGGMFVLFAAFGMLFGGGLRGVLWLGIFGLISVGVGARISPQMVLRAYRARPLHPAQAPQLHTLIAQLARRAKLERPPQPYYVPSRTLNAFAVGARDNAALGVTDGLLRTLNAREIRGVLAHEITHLVNNDAWVMSVADFVTRTVNFFSWVGQLLLLLSLPMILTGRGGFPLPVLLLLILAPTLSATLQLALSRSREYDADLGAARLTGDPRGLASALAKMERLQSGFFERIFMPGRKVPDPSLLRTHPSTEERVERLLQMERELDSGRVHIAAEPLVDLGAIPTAPVRPPRWHFTTGSWY